MTALFNAFQTHNFTGSKSVATNCNGLVPLIGYISARVTLKSQQERRKLKRNLYLLIARASLIPLEMALRWDDG